MKEKEKKIKEKKQKPEKVNKANKEPKTDLVKVKAKKDSNAILRKWLAKTSLTVLLIAIIIAAFIGINIFMEEWKPSDIDLSQNKVYSISQTSKSIIEKIEADVEIILVNMHSVAESVVDFAYRYEKVNDKIKVSEVNDISKEVELANKYNLTDTSSIIIIKSGSKEKTLQTTDLYTVDYTTWEEKDLTEEAMTNAILSVTVTDAPKIYYLSGSTKYADTYIDLFKEELENEANEVEALDLLTAGKIPDDISALMITTLTKDITEMERDLILDYIKQGGKLIIFSDANVGKIDFKNFNKVLEEYGVSISEGIMVEQNANRMLSSSPSAILVTVEASSSIAKQTNMDMTGCFFNSGRLTFKDSAELEEIGITVETLATTSETAFYRSDLSEESTAKIEGDEEGIATVGALVTKTIDEDTTSELIIYSNNMFMTNVQIAISTQYYYYALDFYNNLDIALNSIAYLTGRDDTIVIRKDYDEVTSYTTTEAQQKIVLAVIFAVPALIVITGIVVWQARRRRK